MGQRSSEKELIERIVPIGVGRSSKPADCLVVFAESQLCNAGNIEPVISVRIPRAEAKRMTDIVFDLPGAPKEHFRQGNKGVCGRLVLIQCDYVFELSNALRGAVRSEECRRQREARSCVTR